MVLAYLFRRWGVSRIPWPWFVLLSLVGSLLFALPAVLLWTDQLERTKATAGNASESPTDKEGHR